MEYAAGLGEPGAQGHGEENDAQVREGGQLVEPPGVVGDAGDEKSGGGNNREDTQNVGHHQVRQAEVSDKVEPQGAAIE